VGVTYLQQKIVRFEIQLKLCSYTNNNICGLKKQKSRFYVKIKHIKLQENGVLKETETLSILCNDVINKFSFLLFYPDNLNESVYYMYLI